MRHLGSNFIYLAIKNLKRAKILCPFLSFIGIFIFGISHGQVTVFSDDFSTITNAAWTINGAIGSSSWSVLRSGEDWGARRNSAPEQLELTNDASGTANENGWVFAMTPTSAFVSPYDTILSQGEVVNWAFNMRQIRTDPSGFDGGLYGSAFILAGETATSSTSGNGYAVVLGQSGADPIRLVQYTTGIMGDATLTDIIVSHTTGLADFGNEYLSIKVTFNPCLNQWELFVRNDGTTGFSDPLSGTLTSQGTAINNSLTGMSLPMMAAYWQGSTTGQQTAFFDNITVMVNNFPVADAGNYPAACLNDPNIPLTGSPVGGTWSGVGVTGNNFDPSVGTQTITYLVTDTNGCSATDQALIVVDTCLAPPEMHWVLQPQGEQNGSCTSNTDCQANQLCYTLRYTPNMTGSVTSYTAIFFVDCDAGTNPVLTNTACIMSPAVFIENGCQQFGVIHLGTSGNTGSLMVTQGVPVDLHQVCFTVPQNEIDIVIDGQISVSLDSVMGGGPEDEFPAYETYTIDSIAECGLLPLKFLNFNASIYAERVTQLDWSTAEEINTSHFEIQRSNDGGISFSNIGLVNTKGIQHSINQYQFIDRSARYGKNYYRLKQVDIDGKFQFSPVRNVVFAEEKFNVRVWPNPVQDELYINIQQDGQGGLVQLIDMTGRIILSATLVNAYEELTLDVHSLAPGTYTLLITCEMTRYEERVIIVEN